MTLADLAFITLAAVSFADAATPNLEWDRSTLPRVEIREQKETAAFYCKSPRGCERGTIYISPDIDLTTVRGRSTLVHEAVHFLQDKNNLPYKWSHKPNGAGDPIPCNNWERKAYEVQNMFLAWSQADVHVPQEKIELYSCRED